MLSQTTCNQSDARACVCNAGHKCVPPKASQKNKGWETRANTNSPHNIHPPAVPPSPAPALYCLPPSAALYWMRRSLSTFSSLRMGSSTTVPTQITGPQGTGGSAGASTHVTARVCSQRSVEFKRGEFIHSFSHSVSQSFVRSFILWVALGGIEHTCSVHTAICVCAQMCGVCVVFAGGWGVIECDVTSTGIGKEPGRMQEM